MTEALLQAFEEAVGSPLPAVKHRAAHRWLYARSENPLGQDFLWDPDRALGVCGDWMIGGRVEGAFSSGSRLAKAVQASLCAPSDLDEVAHDPAIA